MVSPNPVQGFAAGAGTDALAQNGGTPSRGIKVAAACTPAITSIQINQQATNTILAGMSGTMTIYGSCLGSSTSVEADGTGLSFNTIFNNTGDVQIDVSFQASNSASGGIRNVKVMGPNGMNSASTAAQVFITKVSLQKFSFSNSIHYYRDCAGNASYIGTPSWPPISAPPQLFGSPLNACPPVGLGGDPAVYSSGSTMQGTAVFAFAPVPPQGIPAISVQGKTSGLNGTFSQTGSVSSNGGSGTFSASVSVDRPFGSSFTQLIDPLNIDWSVDIASLVVGDCAGTCASAGASSTMDWGRSTILPFERWSRTSLKAAGRHSTPGAISTGSDPST